MKQFSPHVLAAVVTLPLLGGCASDVCNRLVFEDVPALSPPLVIPEGVPAIAEGGQYRVPAADAAVPPETCKARPPMTLPPEVLEEPEDDEEEVEEEA